jgi:energy-coupling factor transporter ATP-binding protein EcfA2
VTNKDEIKIRDIGPIVEAAIPRPDGGGVVVLSGRNGCGKSTALDAIRVALGGSADLTPRDATHQGVIEAFGAKITIGKSTRRKGEADVVAIEGRGEIGTLVDPGIADPEAADAARVRAMVSIADREIPLSDYVDLLGSPAEFERIVGPVSKTDPMGVASHVKRRIEAEARAKEELVKAHMATVASLQQQNAGIDLTVESDAAVLAERYATARAAVAKTEAADKAYTAAARRRAEAERQLAGVQLSAGDLAAAWERVDVAQHERLEAQRKEAERKQILEAAQAAYAEAVNSLREAVQRVEMAEYHHAEIKARSAHVETLSATAAEPLPPQVTPADHELAATAVLEAHAAMLEGGKIREGLARHQQVTQRLAESSRLAREGQRLREAAAGIDEILSRAIDNAGGQLRIRSGRVVIETRRGTTPYAELSHGERWLVALQWAIRVVGSGGVLVAPQEAWEGLDPGHRQATRELLTGTGVVLYTAECSDGEGIDASTWYAKPTLAELAARETISPTAGERGGQ